MSAKDRNLRPEVLVDDNDGWMLIYEPSQWWLRSLERLGLYHSIGPNGTMEA